MRVRPIALLVVAVLGLACSTSSAPPPASDQAGATAASGPLVPESTGQNAASPSATAQTGADEPLPPVPSPHEALSAQARSLLDQPFTGDFDEMVKRRFIRAGVVFNRTQYFIDKGVQRGISYESLKLFEDELNDRLKTGLLRVHVAIVPLQRDQLFPALRDGKVDLVAAALTITPERQKVADFSTPTRTGVLEVPVTAPGVPALATPDDLSGREVFVRRSSSYYESVQQLNDSLKSRNRPLVTIKEAPESLEDDDLLEMVNAGLVKITIVDDFVAEFWRQIFTNVTAHPGAAVRTNGTIAVGVRKNNPKLLNAANLWIKKYGPGSAFGNIIERRYLQNTNYVRNATSEAERKKFQELTAYFKKYGDMYNLDYLLMAAQGYQESGLDQSVKSRVGAVGVMQVMPATAKDLNVGDITKVEPNVHAGVKYMRFMVDEFYKDEPMDLLNKGLMTLASYNAGPGRMRQIRAETARRGLNPNVWFGNVERVTSERIGRETVQYVANIYKYYVSYQLVMAQRQAREGARGQR